MKQALASRLKALRQTHNLTQEQLCREISTNARLYYYYERADGNVMPPYIIATKLSRRFDVNIEYLLGLTENSVFSPSEMPPPDDAAIKVIFAFRLSNLRKNKGQTQAATAQSIGITLRGYQSYEYESNPTMPSYETMVAIRNEFSTAIDYLLGNSD
jgi:transcriptional regulator with XRE-family HTH domain